MSLTQSLCCHRLCFTDLACCPNCRIAFRKGTLSAKAVAEDKAFELKIHALFLAAFLAWLVVLLFVQFQHYLLGTG